MAELPEDHPLMKDGIAVLGLAYAALGRIADAVDTLLRALDYAGVEPTCYPDWTLARTLVNCLTRLKSAAAADPAMPPGVAVLVAALRNDTALNSGSQEHAAAHYLCKGSVLRARVFFFNRKIGNPTNEIPRKSACGARVWGRFRTRGTS